MYIDIKKLEKAGFQVDQDDSHIVIHPKHPITGSQSKKIFDGMYEYLNDNNVSLDYAEACADQILDKLNTRIILSIIS